jgi:epoxyqueuosine reductase QueG
MDAEILRHVGIKAGADDIGFVGIHRPEIAGQRSAVLTLFPETRTVVCFLCRLDRHRHPMDGSHAANWVFQETAHRVDSVAATINTALHDRGIATVIPAFAIPVGGEGDTAERLPMLDLKELASAAGLGRVGIHQNLIHPKLGNFVLIGAILMDGEISQETPAMNWNPCIDCYLCVPACPVNAIGRDGSFDSEACFSYAYRDFRAEHPEVSKDNPVLSSLRVQHSTGSDPAPHSVWPTLNCGDETNTAYCLAVCPVGDKTVPGSLKRKKKS